MSEVKPNDLFAGFALNAVIVAAGPAGVTPEVAAAKALEYADALVHAQQAHEKAHEPARPVGLPAWAVGYGAKGAGTDREADGPAK